MCVERSMVRQQRQLPSQANFLFCTNRHRVGERRQSLVFSKQSALSLYDVTKPVAWRQATSLGTVRRRPAVRR